MTDLQTLIRTVDPNDKAGCDELNARFWCFVEKLKYAGLKNSNTEIYPIFKHCYWSERYEAEAYVPMPYCAYTRSLDALKAVQEAELGDDLRVYQLGMDKHGRYGCHIELYSKSLNLITQPDEGLPTMQLAWMDALVQAIQWKRENEDE